jgi:hypothetical protein
MESHLGQQCESERPKMEPQMVPQGAGQSEMLKMEAHLGQECERPKMEPQIVPECAGQSEMLKM